MEEIPLSERLDKPEHRRRKSLASRRNLARPRAIAHLHEFLNVDILRRKLVERKVGRRLWGRLAGCRETLENAGLGVRPRIGDLVACCSDVAVRLRKHVQMLLGS